MAQYTNNPLTITVNTDTEVRAVFAPAPPPPPPQEPVQGFYNVVVSTETPNYGTVSLIGIDGAPAVTPSSISGRVTLGNNFTISANPLSGYRFLFWQFYVQRANGEGSFTNAFTSNNPFQFSTLDEGATLTFVAVFEPVPPTPQPSPSSVVPQYLVQLLPYPSSNLGTVSTDGGTLSGVTVFKRVSAGDSIVIKSTPADGYRFSEWYNPNSGATVSRSATATISVTADITLWALFEKIPPTPTPTPSVSTIQIAPTPSPTPIIEAVQIDIPTVPIPSPSAQLPEPPAPTPSPTPVQWRSCIDGILRDGNAPAGYIEISYTGAGGGTCWEPIGDVGFEPDLAKALYFQYQRGTSEYPQPVTITANNPSYGRSYNVKLTTNSDIVITPREFILAPRSSQQFIVNVTPTLLEKLGDGQSTLSMNVEVSPV